MQVAWGLIVMVGAVVYPAPAFTTVIVIDPRH